MAIKSGYVNISAFVKSFIVAKFKIISFFGFQVWVTGVDVMRIANVQERVQITIIGPFNTAGIAKFNRFEPLLPNLCEKTSDGTNIL